MPHFIIDIYVQVYVYNLLFIFLLKHLRRKKRPLGPPKCPKDSFLLNHTTQGSSFILSRYPHVVVAAQNNKTKVL